AMGNGASTTPTDNSTAFGVALTLLKSRLTTFNPNSGSANFGGGTLYVPAGVFNFCLTIHLPEGITLVGDGPYASMLNYTGEGTAIAWQATNKGDPVLGVIEKLQLTTNNPQSQVGVDFIDVYRATIRDCLISGVNGPGAPVGGFTVAGVRMRA